MQSAVMNSIIMVNVLLMFTYFWVVVARTDPADLAALRSLRNQWQNTPPNWVKGDPCDRRWEGIYCNDSRVIEIILPGTNLAGPLPEDILLLSELQILDLSNNRGLTGPLPSNIGNLTNLVNLVLVGCNFSGPIPGSIGSLQKLTHLFLNTNHFNGNMPHSIGNLTNLIWLDLSENELDGTLPVSNTTTPGLDMLLNANHFHLANNKFSGEIPPRLFSSRMALMHVVLNGNQLNGSIPETLGLVQNLTVIRLDRNFFSGSVPQNLSMLTRVTELYLANNDLSGPIPDLTGMNFLAYVDLSNNSFDALAVPQWFETLPSITTLVMENTRLEGNISTTLFSVPQLQTLVLNNNQLNGTVEIPANISRNLRLLDLRNNSIDGFSSRVYNKTIMLDENPFCLRPEAAGICNTSQPSQYLNFIPLQDCAPLTCFSDAILASDCERPYLGSLIFRSFNFSDLENMLNYAFLNYTLQHHLASRVSIDRVCLVSSMIDANGYLVMNISFFPPDGAYFNRTGVSTVGNVLNNHIYDLPYGPYYYIDLPYTSFPGQSKNTALIIGLSVCGSVLVVLTISAGVYAYRQRKIAQRAAKLNNPFLSWNKGNIPQLKGARWFSFEDVKQCTSNFSYGSEIGVGGYGKVYMGRLSTGELVAIKRAKVGSMQGALEFKSEIELLSRVHHKNVVKLVGFCYDKGEQMLIYEFVPNGSLREALSGKSGVRLNWGRRLKIALGAAKGLAYLHELADPPIIHRDIKSDNILLGDHLDAKVADFGLSIPFSEDRAQLTTQVKGTVGYLDPEYYMTQILTEKSDVYSYGVVMLELVTGRLPLEKNTYVVRVVRETLKETGSINNLVDAAIRSDTLIGMEEFVKLAMKCLQDTGDERPSMSEVVKEIEKMIEASNPNYNAESTTTSASFDVEESDYPYSSNGSFDSRINSPFLR